MFGLTVAGHCNVLVPILGLRHLGCENCLGFGGEAHKIGPVLPGSRAWGGFKGARNDDATRDPKSVQGRWLNSWEFSDARARLFPLRLQAAIIGRDHELVLGI
jgi:hypothetical protein